MSMTARDWGDTESQEQQSPPAPEESRVTVRNPFGAPVPARVERETGSEVAVQAEIARVQAQMMIAHRFPRDQQAAMLAILNACTRPELANVAIYTYARGGTEITGPSIRLAEVLAQSWGNLEFGVRELQRRGPESTVEAYCWDLERNLRTSRVFTVRHERHTRKGTYQLTDERDIYENIANLGARRMRACILATIPADAIDAATQQCEETQRAKVDTSKEAIDKMAEAFEEFGVTKAQIAARCQCHLYAIRPAQMLGLRRVYVSLRDGLGAAADFFPPVTAVQEADQPRGTAGLVERLEARREAGGPGSAGQGAAQASAGEAAQGGPPSGQAEAAKPSGEASGARPVDVAAGVDPSNTAPSSAATPQPSAEATAVDREREWVEGEFKQALVGGCASRGDLDILLKQHAIVLAKQRRYREAGRADLLALMAIIIADRQQALASRAQPG